MYKILIIEDNIKESDSVVFLLGQSEVDFDIYKTDDVNAACEYFYNNRIDIIFVDIDRYQQECAEFLQKIMDNNSDIKVIACTFYLVLRC